MTKQELLRLLQIEIRRHGFDTFVDIYLCGILLEARVGIELIGHIDNTQVTDFKELEKR